MFAMVPYFCIVGGIRYLGQIPIALEYLSLSGMWAFVDLAIAHKAPKAMDANRSSEVESANVTRPSKRGANEADSLLPDLCYQRVHNSSSYIPTLDVSP